MSIAEYIRICDRDFRKRLCDIADDILERKEVRLISLSGPTCSGKTTAAEMLSKRFEERGHGVNIVSIDDFYHGRDYLHMLSEKKGEKTVDYDSVDTIDREALSVFVREAFSSSTVHSPVFDFKSGNRIGYREIEVEESDIFIFEGIQAIYPQIRELFAPYGTVSIYISPRTSLNTVSNTFEPNDIRLLRRLVRDSNFRGTDAEFTLRLWSSVRSNEEKHIFPYADTCDYFLDSTQDYELGVLKPYLADILSKISEGSEFFDISRKILTSLVGIEEIDSALIEEGSLYREFV